MHTSSFTDGERHFETFTTKLMAATAWGGGISGLSKGADKPSASLLEEMWPGYKHTWVVDLIQQFHRPSRDNASNMSQSSRRNRGKGAEWEFLWEKFGGGEWLKRRDCYAYQELTEEDSWRTGKEVGWWNPPLLDEVPAVTEVSMITWWRIDQEEDVWLHLALFLGLSHF